MSYKQLEQIPRKPRHKPPVSESTERAHKVPQKCLDNLRSFAELPKEQHLALSSKGGKASGVSRARQREQIEAIKAAERARQELIHEEVRALKMASRELLRAARSL